jgi:O-antigen/teichoic acid export membrane protein
VEAYLNIPGELRAEAQAVVLLVVATFLASIAFSVFRDALTGVQRLAQVQLVWAVSYIAETVLIFVLVSAGRGIRGLAEAFLIRTVIEVVLSAILAYRTLPWLSLSPRNYSFAELKTLLSFGGAVQLLGFLAIALNSIERMLAAPLIGLHATGLLDIGKKLPSMAASIPSAFASSLIPAASYLQAGRADNEQREAVVKLYVKGARYMNLSAAYICGFLAVMPGPMLAVWLGRDYPEAALLMVLFSVATQIHLMTGPGTSILRGIGRPYAELHYALPNVVALGITLAVAYGIQGGWTTVGIGSAVAAATVVAAVWFLVVANRLLNVPTSVYLRRVVFPGAIPYLIALPLALPTGALVSANSRWTGAAIVLIAGLIYSAAFALIVIRFVFEEGERLWFVAVLRNRLERFLPKSVQAA